MFMNKSFLIDLLINKYLFTFWFIYCLIGFFVSKLVLIWIFEIDQAIKFAFGFKTFLNYEFFITFSIINDLVLFLITCFILHVISEVT